MPTNPFGRSEDRLLPEVFAVLHRFGVRGAGVSIRFRTLRISGIDPVPDHLADALRSVVGPGFRVRFAATSPFIAPTGVASARDLTPPEKVALLRQVARKRSDVPRRVRKEIGARLEAGEDPDSIMTWLAEMMKGNGGTHP